ncbi:hypothetical protein Ancab_017156 [Ancistrocladus abbreviatus]
MSPLPELFYALIDLTVKSQLSEQQPGAVTSPKVVVDNSNFKPEKNGLVNATPRESRANDGMVLGKSRKDDPSQDTKCKIDGRERFSKSFDERVSKSQGWGVSRRGFAPIPPGPERLNGGPPSKSQVRNLNRAECSARPEIRPEFMKTTEDMQRESIFVYSAPLGPTQLK